MARSSSRGLARRFLSPCLSPSLPLGSAGVLIRFSFSLSWGAAVPPLNWRLGPDDPVHPEQVQVIGERPRGHYTAIRYTFDRSKDWICIKQEWEINPTSKRTWEVTAFARTPEGLWYPSKATILGSHYEYAIERGPAEPAFFEYPKGMPEPVDAFAVAMKQAFAAAAASAPATATSPAVVPSTARAGSAATAPAAEPASQPPGSR